jgi:hypothetical protein
MEEFEDISKKCKGCGETFTVTAGEQKWLYEKFGNDFKVPVRCRPCREQRKAQREADYNR